MDEDAREKLQAALAAPPVLRPAFEERAMRRLKFTDMVECALKAQEFQPIIQKVSQEREKLTLKMRGELDEDMRARTRFLLTLLHEQMHTARLLPDCWDDELMVFMDGRDQKGKKKYRAECGHKRIAMSFTQVEPMMLVTTLQTRIVRKAFFEAWADGKMLLLKGPPGTGKTESFQDLCKEVGFTGTVIGCNDGVEAETLRCWISNNQTVVLEDANNLSPACVAALPAMVKEAGKHFVCCTLLGDAGVPEAWADACVLVELTRPDLKLVFDVMLSAEGFVTSERLAGYVDTFVGASAALIEPGERVKGLRLAKEMIQRAGAKARQDGYDDEKATVMWAASSMVESYDIDEFAWAQCVKSSFQVESSEARAE